MGTSATLRVYAPVALTAGEPWQISYRMKLGSDTSATCLVLLNSSVYSGTGAPPSWGSAWICGFGKWSGTTAGASDMPYLTSASSGGWYANPTSGEWHKIDMKYYPGKGVRYFLDNTLIGIYNITIGTRLGYITAYIHAGNSVKDLVFLDKTDLLIDDYTQVVITGSYYSIPSVDECGNSWTVNGTGISIGGTAEDGGWLDFAGSGSYLSFNEGYLGGQDFEISLDLYLSSSSGSYPAIFVLFNTANATDYDWIAVQRSGTSAALKFGATSKAVTANLSYNTWYHLIYSYDHTDEKIVVTFNNTTYTISGVSLDEVPYANIWLGKSNYSADGSFVGRIKNFRIRNSIRKIGGASQRYLQTANGPTLQDTLCLPMNGQDECGNPMYWDGSTPAITDNSNSYPSVHSPKYNFANNRRYWFDNVGLGGADFTIEGWAYVSTSTESYGRIFEWVNTGSTGNRMEFCKYSTNAYLYCTGITCNTFVNNLTYMNQNFHFAIVYEHKAQKLSLYINGILKGSLSSYNIPYQTRRLWLSGSSTSSANRLYGNISEFRVSHDIARWTENFPMYNQAFTKDSYTVALCHFTSSPTADDCGNTWSVIGTPAIINGELSLDGSSYLQLDGGIDIGGQDFTVEAWVCHRQYSGYRRIWHIGNTLSKNDITLCNNNTAGTFWWSTNGTNIITGTNYWNQRVHVAQVYKHSEGKSYYYVNGTLVGTTTNTIERYHAQYVWLGRGAYTDAYMVGQIKEFRISDGIARYNHAFPLPAQNFPDGTPSTRYVKDPNTKILLHGDNPYFYSGNTPATDWSGNIFKYCKDLTVTTDHAKFTNALLITPHESWLKSTTPFNFTGQDFCIDFWAYATTPAAYSSNVPAFFSLNKDIHETPYPRLTLHLQSNATTLRVMTTSLAGAEVGAQATVTMINTLNHYAVTYSAGVVKVYVNGTLKITLTANLESARYYVCIGGNPAASTVNTFNSHFGGYISEFRISNNICRWTGAFTPATAAYGTDTNTWSLLHFSSVTADACSNTTWEQFCIKPIFSTTVVPFSNSSSVYFANGAQLRCDSYKLGGADFTIEGWVYMSSTQGAYARIFEYLLTPGTTSHGINFYRNNTSAALVFVVCNSAGSSASITTNVTDNAWHHWAIVQEYAAGTNKLYIDGVYKGVVAKVIDRVSREFVIGRSSWVADGPTVGYMADFHVTDGVAKYKKNFQPPLDVHYSHGKFKDSTITGTVTGSMSSYSHAGVKDSYGSTTDSEIRDNGNQLVRKSFATQGSTGTAARNALLVTKQKTGGLVTQSKGAKNYVSDKTGVRVQVPEILNTTFDYNGAAQFPVLRNIDYDKVSVTNFVATAAGTYDLTLTLKNLGYLWTMGHKDPIIKQWIINTTISLSATDTILLNPSTNKATFTYTAPVSSYGDTFQNVTVSSNNTAVCTAELSGTTITVWRKGTGSATITVQGVMNGYTHKITRAVTVSAIDDATVSYMKFDNAASPITDLVSANTWVPYGFQAVYYGQTLANKNQNFDLTKDWSVSFDYRYVSGGGGDWNCVFSFGHTINIHGNDTHIQIFGGYSTGTYSATYNAAAHTLTTVVNGTTTVTENYTRTETSYNGFYVGAGGQWRNHTFYCTNFTIRAYLAGATTQSTGTYNFAGGTLTGTGDIKIDVFRSGGIRIIDNVKYVGTTNARSGYSLAFEGPQYLLSNNTVSIADTDFTVEWWGYMSSATTQSGGFWMLSPSNNSSQGYTTANRIGFERINGTTNITIDVISSSGSSMYTDNLSYNCTGLILDQFNHYAFVYNKATTTIQFYLNGILKFSRVCNIPQVTRYIFLGTSSFTYGQFKGTIDEFRISNCMRYSGNFTPLTTAYDLVGPSTVVTIPSVIGSAVTTTPILYDTENVVLQYANATIDTGTHTATAYLMDTVNQCWTDGTIAPKIISYTISADIANRYNTCIGDAGSISTGQSLNLSTLIKEGQTQFIYNDCCIYSGASSYNVNNGTSHYWIKIKPTVNLTLYTRQNVSSEGNWWDVGEISVGTTPVVLGRNATSITNGTIIYRQSGTPAINNVSIALTANTTYYIGLHYAKDGSAHGGSDRFYVRGISLVNTDTQTVDATGRPWNKSGTVTIQNTTAKFGNALQVDGAGYMYHDTVTLGGQDFTVECWGQFTGSMSGTMCFVQCWKSDTDRFQLGIVNSSILEFWDKRVSVAVQVSSAAINTWYHMAVVYIHEEGKLYYYVNGVKQSTTVTDTITAAQYRVLLGANCNNAGLKGVIEEVRISKRARYTEDFTPPTAAFTDNDTATLLLQHF